MRETYQPPTTSPAGPPHDQKVSLTASSSTPTTSPAGPPHGHTHPRHSRTHPRHSRTHPRHSRTHPRHSHTRPRHSRTHPRHSRVGGNPPRCVQTPEETALLPPSTEFDKTRQNTTKYYRNSCAPAHARARQPLPSFPRRRESSCPPAFRFLSLCMDCSQVAADSTYRLELPSHKHHANESNGTASSQWLTRAKTQSRAPRHTSPESMETAPHPLPAGESERLGRETSNVQHPNREVLEICDSTS